MLSRTEGDAIVDDLMEENTYTPGDDSRPKIFISGSPDGEEHSPGGDTGETDCSEV